MKVLILGGTAFFGKDIARFFHEAGHSVTLFTRGNNQPTDLPPHQRITGDRDKLADLQRAAKADRWDIVVDNLAYHARHVEDALTAFPDVKRYLLCSTVSVYRFVRDKYPQPIKESALDFDYRPPAEDPNDVHWKYARGKMEAERVLTKQNKVCWTALRPPVVYGPFDVTDRGFWYLGRIQKGGPILLAGDGAHSFKVVYSVDCARAFLQAAESPRAENRAYNIAQTESITLRDFIEESAAALGHKAELVSVPAEFLGPLAELGGPYAAPIMINLLQDNTAAAKDFGYAPTPWREFAKTSAHWFRDKWKGDATKLFASREKELALANAFRKATAGFTKG